MSVERIYELVRRVKRRTMEDDPFRICKELHIQETSFPMGREENACKGFFVKKAQVKTIVVNADLTRDNQRIILSHEIGHAMLHGNDERVCAYHDFCLFNDVSISEYEANIFAAEFLISDDDALELLSGDTFFFGAASMLRVPPELLDFKFRSMKRRGFSVNPPMMAKSDFLKNLTKTDRY